MYTELFVRKQGASFTVLTTGFLLRSVDPRRFGTCFRPQPLTRLSRFLETDEVATGTARLVAPRVALLHHQLIHVSSVDAQHTEVAAVVVNAVDAHRQPRGAGGVDHFVLNEFLQELLRGLAPGLRGFWGIDVEHSDLHSLLGFFVRHRHSVTVRYVAKIDGVDFRVLP